MIVLLVEDEPWLSDIYSKSLILAGHKVYEAPDAQDGLDLLDEHPEIKLVIVDMLLPHHNGLAFLYEAASHIDWQDKRFVVLSSVPREELSDDEDFSLRSSMPAASLELERRVAFASKLTFPCGVSTVRIRSASP